MAERKIYSTQIFTSVKNEVKCGKIDPQKTERSSDKVTRN